MRQYDPPPERKFTGDTSMSDSGRTLSDSPMNASDRLRLYSDGQLQEELNRRKKEREEKAAVERKAREVRVVCPNCSGTGRTIVTDPVSGYPTEWRCCMCNGERTIVALRA